MPHASVSPETRQCIDDCLACASVCYETVRHCLELGGEHAAPEHIASLLDCAEICLTSLNFMSRGSGMSAQICEACAETCERCAESCERFDDDVMRKCAEICRRTAESCRRMARVAA
jgi:hypothetical protein